MRNEKTHPLLALGPFTTQGGIRTQSDEDILKELAFKDSHRNTQFMAHLKLS